MWRPPITRKQRRTMKNALGKQGLTMAEHKAAQKSTTPCEILQIDCFTLEAPRPEDVPNGWYVGYGVQYNGVGVSAAQDSSASSDEEPEDVRNPEEGNESSGFDSDPSTDEENPQQIDEHFRDLLNRRDSDDVSDNGQILYGVAEEDRREPTLFVDKKLVAKDVPLQVRTSTTTFKTGKLVTTNRFSVPAAAVETPVATHRGYRMIGDGIGLCADSPSEDDGVIERPLSLDFDWPTNSSSSSGLWCNFIITPPGLERKDITKVEISKEKLQTIPLDKETLAQISAAMANFKLPTPPGWEGVSDSKILDFINRRV